MFCLRTWIPVLFFLINVSPIYLILFISATWYLNRPCLYCSLLLTVLVISLYDWRSDWFESRNNLFSPLLKTNQQAPSDTPTDMSLPHAVMETASAAAASVLDSSAMSSAHEVVDSVVKRIAGQGSISGAQWLRDLVGRKEWRVPCLDVIVRL